MLDGNPPFTSKTRTGLFKNILNKKVYFKKHFSEEAKDLIAKLLKKDPELRLGSNSLEDIKNHKFFESINWNELKAQKN